MKAICKVGGSVAKGAICGYIRCSSNECGAKDHASCVHSSTYQKPEAKDCPFCGGVCDPNGWLDGKGNRGPECEVCGSTAPSLDVWNGRYTGKPDMS